MERLHPASRWLFRFGGYFFMVLLFVFTIAFMVAATRVLGVVFLVIYLVLYVIAFFALPELYARLAYNNWAFEFTKTNLKIEKGIIWKKYSNIPYERVQNIDIQRGILARMFGFSTVNIQTAGYSAYRGRPMSEGYIPAVSRQRAEEIREFVMKKIGKKQGL